MASVQDEILIDGHGSEFVPPIGFDKMNLPSLLLSEDEELFLFRIPENVELNDLVGLKIPKTQKSNSKLINSTSNFVKKDTKYLVKYVGSHKQEEENHDSMIQAGEMMDMVCVAPKQTIQHKSSQKSSSKQQTDHAIGVLDAHEPTSLRILPKERVSRMYHVGLDITGLSKPEDFEKAGQVILNRPFAKREQPAGMKLQSPPIGFDTDGTPLKESLELCPEVKSESKEDSTSSKKKNKRKQSQAPSEASPARKKKSKKE